MMMEVKTGATRQHQSQPQDKGHSHLDLQMRATFSRVLPPKNVTMTAPPQSATMPLKGSVVPHPRTLSQTTTLATKMANDQQMMARGAALHHLPSSLMFCWTLSSRSRP